MPLMGSLWIGASGLQTSQNALNTTAHNLSNMETVGYTRQQVQQATKAFVTISPSASAVGYQQYGLGTNYARVKHVRDYFLDKSYRKEVGRCMFYEVSKNVLEEVESQLGELNGEAFQTTVADLWTAVQELSKDPTNSVTQGLLVQRASEFVERSNSVYNGLASYQDNLNQQVKQNVQKINDYGKKILDLNDRIRAIESGGIEHANDLRDARDQMLDELAQLSNISFAEDISGNVSVQIEGVDFVKGGMCYEIALDVDPATGFYTPFWPQNASYKVMDDGTKSYNIDGAEVFDLNIKISSDLGTDVGGLKAMLFARGDHRANYQDATDEESYQKVSQSVIMNVQAEFDKMIHHVVGAINDILATAAGRNEEPADLDIVLPDGTTKTLQGVKFVKDTPDGYMRDLDGSPLQLFNKITTPAYEKVTGTDGETYWVYKEEEAAHPDSMYTVTNIRVNQHLMQNATLLGFRLEDGSEDLETTAALKEAFTQEIYKLNPTVQKKTTFMDFYSDLVSQISNSGYVYRTIYESQETTVEAVDSAREQIVGVSSDEELSNMIKFQNAYNASSRYINAISEMLEHIITTLGG